MQIRLVSDDGTCKDWEASVEDVQRLLECAQARADAEADRADTPEYRTRWTRLSDLAGELTDFVSAVRAEAELREAVSVALRLGRHERTRPVRRLARDRIR